MDSQQLLPRTRVLLANCDRPLIEIAKGAKVGFEWLRKFKADLIPNPGVNNVQALHDYLVSSQRGGPSKGSARSSATAA
jgi:hypothetical protein